MYVYLACISTITKEFFEVCATVQSLSCVALRSALSSESVNGIYDEGGEVARLVLEADYSVEQPCGVVKGVKVLMKQTMAYFSAQLHIHIQSDLPGTFQHSSLPKGF